MKDSSIIKSIETGKALGLFYPLHILPVNTHTFLYANNSTCLFTDKHDLFQVDFLISGKASETVWSVSMKKTWPGRAGAEHLVSSG